MAIDVDFGGIRRLSGAEEMRAYAHPTRMAILAILAGGPLTLSMTAKRMAVHPANLSRHFKVLSRAGLIVLVETRDTGRNLEKYYRAVAASFLPDLEGLSPAGKRELALGVLRDELGAAMQRLRAKDAPPEADMLALLSVARLLPKDREVFFKRLRALVKEFSSLDTKDGQAYAMGLSLFPALHFPEGAKNLEITEKRRKKK
jgi:DNA-binding transcriptional ArsR family regulator